MNYHVEHAVVYKEFFRNNVLQITDGLENLGTLRWPLSLCLAATYITVYFCIIKGIRIAGKVVYVTVSAPFILVTVILIRACTLPGSLDGILYYITPDFYKLASFDIWMEACSFALYAPGIAYGIVIKLATHNPISNNCFKDVIIVNLIVAFSQVYFGFSVFAMTGHLAHERGVTMQSYNTSGFKLGFITYPEATSYLPIPQLWSVLLFVMLFTLGIDSLIPAIECVTSVIGHIFPALTKRRWLLNAAVMVPFFFLSLPYTTQGGVYLLTLVEWFAFFPSMILFAAMMCVALPWAFGISRINNLMGLMWGGRTNTAIVILWKYVCPLMLLIIFGYSLYSYRPPMFEDYVYAWWANLIGWSISLTVISPLPVYFIYAIWQAEGQTLMEKFKSAAQPQGKWKLEELTAELGESEKEQMENTLM